MSGRALWLSLVVLLLGAVVGLWSWFAVDLSGPVDTDPLRPTEAVVGHLAMELTAAPAAADEQARRQALELAAPRTDGQADLAATVATRLVRGQVLRASDRTPLPGATVAGRVGSVDVPVTDEAGAFSISVAAETASLVVALHERQAEFDLPAGSEDVDDFVAVLDSGFRIQGRVLDTDGAPIAGARVFDEGLSPNESRTDAGGRFSAYDVLVEPGRVNVQVTAEARWFERGSAPVLVPADVTTVATVELRLTRSGALAGVVRDTTGQAVPDVDVVLAVHSSGSHGDPHNGRLAARTADDGSYRIESVSAGTWLVEFQATAALAGRWVSGVVVTEGETTQLDATLSVGASLAGRVTDEAGSPVPGASVSLERIESWTSGPIDGTWVTGNGEVQVVTTPGEDGLGRTQYMREEQATATDARGEYALSRLTAGAKRLTVAEQQTSQGLASFIRDLELADDQQLTGYDIRLPAGLSLRGVVVDAAGRALVGAHVSVERRLGFVPLAQGRGETGADGRFEIRGLPDGDLELTVYAQDMLSQFRELRAGGRELEIALQSAPRVIGSVRDARDGRALTEFTLRVSREGSSTSRRQSSEDGSFSVEAWDDEAYDVTVAVGGYVRETKLAVHPSDTRDAPLIFELQPEPR